jgi:hypothetical protein
MKTIWNKIPLKRGMLLLLLVITQDAFSQETNSAEKGIHFNGDISVTNNGFSLIPTFSLGKPASIMLLSVGGDRFSFNPQFRINLEDAQMWTFVFIWRYKVIDAKKFQLTAGVHLPAIAFRSVMAPVNGVMQEMLITQRFLTFELTPNLTLTKNVSTGFYYLYAVGLETADQPKNTHFLGYNFNFSRIQLSKKFYLKFSPQVYYLKIDQNDGFYFASNLALAVSDFPLSISSQINKAIDTDISSKDFDWNISLIYSFKNQMVKKKG